MITSRPATSVEPATGGRRDAGAAGPGPEPYPQGRRGRGRVGQRRRLTLLTAAAVVSPVALAAQYAIDTAGLPRQEAATYLAAVAAAPGRGLASVVVYGVGIVGLVAVAALVAIACRASAPVLSAVAAGLMAAGAVGGGGFVAIRLTALSLTSDGGLVPGAVAAFTHIQTGVLKPLAALVLAAAIGQLVIVAAMVRSRRMIGTWVAPAWLVGFVLASGELPSGIGVVGGLLQAAALVVLARWLLSRDVLLR
jgi:hypothetical protein